MKQLRIKKKCGKCKYVAGFPYIHCTLECEMDITTKGNVFIAKPKDKIDCKHKRLIAQGEKR